jgi:hypothetical protein
MQSVPSMLLYRGNGMNEHDKPKRERLRVRLKVRANDHRYKVNGKRVREIGFPVERKGTITTQGIEGSTVRWDNGDVRNVSNKYLITLNANGRDDEDVKTDWQRKEEKGFLQRKGEL